MGNDDFTGLPPDQLYRRGVLAFNSKSFYDAHEYWEELWTEHPLSDRKFIQGLIQLAVGCFHLTNDNLNGARGLFTKCLPKLNDVPDGQRGLSMPNVVAFVEEALVQVDGLGAASEFDWSRLPLLPEPAETDS